jgi:hypothetical protein
MNVILFELLLDLALCVPLAISLLLDNAAEKPGFGPL